MYTMTSHIDQQVAVEYSIILSGGDLQTCRQGLQWIVQGDKDDVVKSQDILRITTYNKVLCMTNSPHEFFSCESFFNNPGLVL